MKIQKLLKGLMLGALFFQIGGLYAKKSKASKQASRTYVRSGERERDLKAAAQKKQSAKNDELKKRLIALAQMGAFAFFTTQAACQGDLATFMYSVAGESLIMEQHAQYAGPLRSYMESLVARRSCLLNAPQAAALACYLNVSQAATFLINPLAPLFNTTPSFNVLYDVSVLSALGTLFTTPLPTSFCGE